jgi:hypothetical protein
MKNYQKVYNQIMRGMIKENLDGDESPRYEVYEGSEEDIFYIADLDQAVNDLQQRIMNGAHCELKHVAFAEDLNEMGMNATVGDDVYLLDSPTDFTQPAFILS